MLDGPGQRRRRSSVQCRRVPALGVAAGELPVFLLGAERVARRVAAAAVAERLDEVRAAVPFGAARRLRTERGLAQVERVPAGDQRPDAEREADVVRPVRRPHRVARHQVCVERVQVVVARVREVVVRERRIEVRSVARDPLAHRANERALGPAADPGLGVRSDVGAVDRAERRRQGNAAGVRSSVARGVAARAAADRRKTRPALDRRRIERLRRRRRRRDARTRSRREDTREPDCSGNRDDGDLRSASSHGRVDRPWPGYRATSNPRARAAGGTSLLTRAGHRTHDRVGQRGRDRRHDADQDHRDEHQDDERQHAPDDVAAAGCRARCS